VIVADSSVVFNIIARDQASGTMKKIGNAAGALFSGLAIGKGLDAVKEAITLASDLGETQSKVNTIFGASAVKINAWAATSATALGQSTQQAMDAAATFSVFGKAAGLTGDKLVGFSENLVQISTDLASFSNTSPEEALAAIQSGLQGEAEPLRKYGILLDDASLRQEALRLGLVKTTKDALTPQQRVLAAQALIMKQTTTQQGDFARTSGGLANQQRILAAEFTNVKTQLGSQLLPTMLKFTQGLMSVIAFVQTNQGWLKPIAVGLGVMAVAIWAVTAAQTAWNIAMALNPIGLIVIAIIGLVAAFVYLWTHSAAFRNFFIGIWHAIWNVLKAIGSWFAGPFADFFKAAWKVISDAAMWFWNNVLSPLVNAWLTGFQFVWNLVASFGAFWWFLWKNTIGAAAMWVWNSILQPMWDGFKRELAAVGAVFSWWANTIVLPAWHLVTSAASAAWGVLKPVLGFVEDKVKIMGGTFKSIFGAIAGFISSAFHDAVGITKSSINALISLINKAVGFINNNVIDNANKVPGVNFPHIPSVPHLASGGIVQVGENGTEIVALPNGAAVYPHGTVPAGMAGGGGYMELRAAPGDQVAEMLLSLLRPVVRGRYSGNPTAALGGF